MRRKSSKKNDHTDHETQQSIEPASSDAEKSPWKIQWVPLWSELKSWRNYWNNSEKTDVLENFGTSSVFFASSVYDVSTDALVADSYYSGTDYTKNFKEETNDPNCTKIGTTQHTIYDDYGGIKNQEITISYTCTEADPWWGILSASFIFVPGIAFWSLVAYGLRNRKLSLLIFLLSPVLIPLFPFLLISAKFIAILHYGPHWKALCTLMTMFEGQFESLLQLGLQTYIIFKESDRKPSLFQLSTIPISMAMIILGQTRAHYAEKPVGSLTDDIKRKILIAPLFLALNVSFLGIPILLAANDIWLTVYQLTPALVFIAIILAISETFCKGLKVILPMLVNVWFFGLLIWTDLSKIQNDSLAEVRAFMITSNIVVAFWMSFHPIIEGPNEKVTEKFMKVSRYIQLLLFFILISLKV